MPEHNADNFDDMRHEPTAVSARAVSIAAAILFGGLILALLLMAGLSMVLTAVRGGDARVAAPGTPVAPPPGVPRVDADQTGTLRELRAREHTLLSEYAWVDRDAGVARIPIHRAMEILAQQPTPTPELTDEDMAGQ